MVTPVMLQPAPSPSAPSLVDTCITRPANVNPEKAERDYCKEGYWRVGVCQHGAARWFYVPCKRRACAICGAARRKQIAWRIAHGIEALAGEDKRGAAWFVGTFAEDITKAKAVKIQRQFIKWVRKYLGYNVEYATTWELTVKGRLHVNIILAPWRYVPQGLLSSQWEHYKGGKVVWIKRVGAGVGQEAAKSRNLAAGYFSKFEQMVNEGRSACYSKGWPKLPDSVALKRLGDVTWLSGWSYADRALLGAGSGSFADCFDSKLRLFLCEREKGYWEEVRQGEYRYIYEDCNCFELVEYQDSS